MAVTLRNITKAILVGSNLFASILLLALHLQTHVHPMYGWWLNLLAMGLPLLLLLQAGFLIFWLVLRRKWFWLPLCTLIAAWPQMNAFFAIGGLHQKTTEKHFTLATWNTHLFNFYENNGSLDEAMLAHARELGADILLLQELVFSLNENSPISLEAIRKKLGYRYVVAANDRAFGVHTQKKGPEDHYHPFCVAIFSNYPIVRWQKVKTENRYNYTFLWADIKVKKDTLRIFNVHLQTMHFARGDYEFIENINEKNIEQVKQSGTSILRKMRNAYFDRAAQAEVIVASVAASPYPVILGGDFNDVPVSYAYSLLRKQLNDAFVRSGWGVGRTFMRLSPSLRIDYLFCSPPLEPLSARVVHPAFSDHLPVVADFLLPRK